MDKTNRWMVGRKKIYMKTIDGWLDGWIETIDGWMDRKKQMNGGKDKKNRCIVGWMKGYKIIYIYIYIYIYGYIYMGRKEGYKYEKNDGMLDGQKNI